jgi:Na+-transporting NADH:ubiquinone oxidoreductase subunit B
MKFLREIHDKQAELFKKGAKLERLYPLFEAHDTFVFTPDSVTKTGAHVRDGLDLKRMMSVVVVALLPCMFMAMYNTGYQANLAIQSGALPLANWQTAAYSTFFSEFNTGFLQCMVHGLLYYLPIYVVTLAAGGAMEALFSVVRKHEINEGFLVTSALLPLTLPATQPLWQVAMAIIFGVVLGKEIYGGTGMNWLNPALTARAFLFFAYPAQISGDGVWIAAQTSPDGYSGATWLSRAFGGVTFGDGPVAKGVAAMPRDMSWMDAFIGFIPGSMGETSALACILGAVILIVTKVGSWRTIAGCLLGSLVMTFILNLCAPLGGDTLLSMPVHWHWVLGGFAFATVFMATDPVSSAFTDTGKLIYGFCIGFMGIIIRVINPAYPEGFMMAILFMNMFAPLIDHFVVQANIKRRAARYAA